jgi:hypothetical protein
VTHPTADYREPGDAAWDGWPTTLALFVGLIGTMASLFVGIAIVFTHDVVLGSRPKPLWPWVAGVLAAQTVLVTGIVQLTRGAFGEYRQRAAKEANLIANRPTGDPMAKDTTTAAKRPSRSARALPLGVLIKTFASADTCRPRGLPLIAGRLRHPRGITPSCAGWRLGRRFRADLFLHPGRRRRRDRGQPRHCRQRTDPGVHPEAGGVGRGGRRCSSPAAAPAVDYESGLADAR